MELTNLETDDLSFKATFSGVNISILNALRTTILDRTTCWALSHVVLEKWSMKNIDLDTFEDILGDIPIPGFVIAKLSISNKSRKPRPLMSDDLSMMKSLQPVETNIQIDGTEDFKCLVELDNKGMRVSILVNKTSIRDNYLEDKIKEYYKELTGEGAFILGRYNSRIITRTNDDIEIPKNIKLFDLQENDEIQAVVVASIGDPLEDPRWNAVSLCSVYRGEMDSNHLDFTLKSPVYSPRNIFKDAVEANIDLLRNISEMVDEDAELTSAD